MKTRRLNIAAPSLAVSLVLAFALAPSASAGQLHPGGFKTGRNLATSSVVLQWYDITNSTVTDAAFPQPVTASNAWDVSWLAASHAVEHRRRDPRYQVAALAQALHDTLVWLVPGQQIQLDSDLASTLATIPNGPAKSDGIAAGQQAAASVIADRQNDGLDTASVDIPFTPPAPGPGVWQPTPPAYGPASVPARATRSRSCWPPTTSSTPGHRPR
jgi:hypothetical protein